MGRAQRVMRVRNGGELESRDVASMFLTRLRGPVGWASQRCDQLACLGMFFASIGANGIILLSLMPWLAAIYSHATRTSASEAHFACCTCCRYIDGVFVFIIRLEARLRPNIGFTLRRNLAVFTRSAITPPKSEPIWMKSGALEYIVQCWWLALADFWRDLRSSDSLKGRRNFIFCPLNNARF